MQYTWIFYDYDDDNLPVFKQYRNGRYTVYDNHEETTVKGYDILKKIYAYDLFALLRPSRLYSKDYFKLEVKNDYVDELAVNENNMYIKNNQISLDISNMLIDSLLDKLNPIPNNYNFFLVNKEQLGRDTVRTGDIVRISDLEDVTKDYVILVKGDINGDGNINSLDVSYLTQDIIDKSSGINEKNLLAGDVNDDNINKINDVMLLLKTIYEG